MKDFPVGERTGQLFQGSTNRRQPLKNVTRRQHRDVIFREVDARFQRGYKFHELLLDRLQAAGERTLKLLSCDFRLVKSL